MSERQFDSQTAVFDVNTWWSLNLSQFVSLLESNETKEDETERDTIPDEGHTNSPSEHNNQGQTSGAGQEEEKLDMNEEKLIPEEDHEQFDSNHSKHASEAQGCQNVGLNDPMSDESGEASEDLAPAQLNENQSGETDQDGRKLPRILSALYTHNHDGVPAWKNEGDCLVMSMWPCNGGAEQYEAVPGEYREDPPGMCLGS